MRLAIRAWHASYSHNPLIDSLQDALHIEAEVDLEEPVRGVSSGSLVINGRRKDQVGFLHYNDEKRLGGSVWVSEAGALGLVTLLSSNHSVKVDLRGDTFFYRKALVHAVSWFTEGHRDFADS